MSANAIAFYIGLFGSIHCIGMCGPLAFAIPAGEAGRGRFVFDKFIYQIGRIVSYSLLGLLIGFIGRQIWLLGVQQGVSIASGILILMAAFSRLFKLSFARSATGNKAFSLVNRSLVYAVKHRWGHLFIGMLNGLLPCGFVYLALVGAINTSSAANAMTYMFFFGLGTLPLMLLATVGSGFMGINVRRKMNRVVPYFMLFLGTWFVLRGLSLDIPYLSPAIRAAQAFCR